MPFQSPHEVTLPLRGWCRGDAAALDKLMPIVFDELQRLAHNLMPDTVMRAWSHAKVWLSHELKHGEQG